jgi:signal transduction histidine kinase
MSVRARLTLWYVSVLAGLLILYITAVVIFQYQLLEHQMVHDEIEDAETVEGLLYFDAQGKLHLEQNYYSHPRSHLLVDRLMEVRDLSGVVLYRTSTLNGQSLGGPTLPEEGNTSSDAQVVKLADGTHVFMISHLHVLEGKELLIRLGYSLGPLRDRMLQFLLFQLVAMPIGLIIASFAGYGLAKRTLAPLDLMAARAEQITASNLHDRLTVENEYDELGHMARVLNHLLQRLEQAFSQLQRFTADAAHELRTPLASLRSTGEVALQEGQRPEDFREAISSMLEETARLSQTVDGLLLLSKTETFRAEEARTSFLLPDLVSEILTLLEVLIEERRLTVQQKHDGNVRRPITADRSLVRVALLNVLHNAVKFSISDSVLEISHSRTTFRSHDGERVCIHDSGPGIAPGEHQRVFERFFTSKSTGTVANSGSGLGLSITKLVIDRSGGQISFDQSVTTGARCCIDLPLRWHAKSMPIINRED